MTTALQIIDRAYVLLGYKAAGETLGPDDTTQGLDALNAMLDGWNTQNLFIVADAEIVATVSGLSATIGPGMQFSTPRPVQMLNGAFSRIGGIDYPIEWLSREEYAAIPLKTVGSTFPEFGYYDQGLPTGRVYFYPVSGSVEVHLPVQVPIVAFTDIATDYALAPGYLRAMQYSLAEELAPGLKDLPLTVVRAAANARRAIRRTNVSVPLLASGVENVRFNIYSGQ